MVVGLYKGNMIKHKHYNHYSVCLGGGGCVCVGVVVMWGVSIYILKRSTAPERGYVEMRAVLCYTELHSSMLSADTFNDRQTGCR